MIEPQSEQAGLSAVSKITVGCPILSRSSRAAACPLLATTFNPSRIPGTESGAA
jgi:hypothetical protein